MTREDDNSKEMELALWRYGILSPLLHLKDENKNQTKLLDELAGKSRQRPDGRLVSVSAETVRKWLYRFRQGGLPGLHDRPRRGTSLVPDSMADRLFALREKHPRWTIQRMTLMLLEEGLWNGHKPSRTAIYRFTKAKGLARDPQSVIMGRAFSFNAFGELWVADFMHGPKLRVKGSKKKTILHVIMDDCSRYVVQGSFSFGETVEILVGELRQSIGRYGVPQRFYVDNGPSYASRHLEIVCARLSIQLCHTPPYRPQGRGKIERFFRTVRDQFLAGLPLSNLAELNEAFNQWLSQYHRRTHSSLECPPLEKRMQVRQATHLLPETACPDALFYMERRCRVYSDGTIAFKKRRYEVLDQLPGSRVTISYLPRDLTEIYYDHDFKRARPLNPHANAHRFNHPRSSKEPKS